MADSVIGSIRAILQLDTAAFTSGTKEAQGALAQLESKFTATAKKLAVGLGLGLAAKQFAESVKGAIDSADELGKASQKFGVPVAQLSALKFAAELADVSFESLGKGLGKLSKAMLDGLVNPSGEAAKSFKALGVSVKDSSGNLRSTEDVFGDVAQRFSQMEDGAAKTALAIRIFGKSGAELIPLLNSGRDGIKKMTDEARELGIVISQETALKAELFNDTLKKIHAAGQALFIIAAENLLPALQKIADYFLDAKKQGTFLKDVLSNLITEGDLQEVSRYGQYWENIVRLWAALRNTDPTEKLSGFMERIGSVITENQKKVQDLELTFSTFNLTKLNNDINLIALAFQNAGKGAGDLDLAALKTKDSIEKWIETQKRQADAQAAANQIIGAATGVAEAARFQSELDNKVIQEKTRLTGEQIAMAEKAKQAIVFAAQTADLKSFVEAGKSEWDQYNEKLVKVQATMDLFPQEAVDLQKTLEKMQRDITNSIAGSLATALGGFSALFMAAGAHNEKLFNIGKAFAIAEATVNTFKAANQALTAPPGPPFSFVYVAGAIAAGIANVLKITQTKMTPAATGGRFRVPGGMMGVDTGIFPMKLAPGELVDVTPTSQAGGVGDRTLNIPAIRSRDFFTGDTVREMVLAIDQWMRDGGTGVRVGAGIAGIAR